MTIGCECVIYIIPITYLESAVSRDPLFRPVFLGKITQSGCRCLEKFQLRAGTWAHAFVSRFDGFERV